LASEAQRVVVDPVDDGSLSAQLGQWDDPTSGVAIVNPTPGIATPRNLATELLVALGKSFDALCREGFRDSSSDDPWRLAQLWLRAESIRHLVVLDADRMHPRLWNAVSTLATRDRTVWLVVRTAAAAQRLAPLVPAREAASALLAALPQPTAPLPPTVSTLTPDLARRFRRVVTPACACALALATLGRYDPCLMAGLSRRSLGVSGRMFTVGGRRFPVPAYARALIWAQLLARPTPSMDGPLFFDQGRRRPSPPQLAAWLRRATGGPACRNPLLNVWPSCDDGWITDRRWSRPLTFSRRLD